MLPHLPLRCVAIDICRKRGPAVPFPRQPCSCPSFCSLLLFFSPRKIAFFSAHGDSPNSRPLHLQFVRGGFEVVTTRSPGRPACGTKTSNHCLCEDFADSALQAARHVVCRCAVCVLTFVRPTKHRSTPSELDAESLRRAFNVHVTTEYLGPNMIVTKLW